MTCVQGCRNVIQEGEALTLKAMIRSCKTNVCRRAFWQLHFLRFTERIRSGILG